MLRKGLFPKNFNCSAASKTCIIANLLSKSSKKQATLRQLKYNKMCNTDKSYYKGALQPKKYEGNFYVFVREGTLDSKLILYPKFYKDHKSFVALKSLIKT